MFVFVLPCVVRSDFSFQYDRSGHMCTWNQLGQADSNSSAGKTFNYITVSFVELHLQF